MKRILLAILFSIGGIASASALCGSPAVMHDFPGTSFNMSLATTPDGNCGSNISVPSWAGGTLGAMANFGTSPGAVLVPGMNAFVTNTVTANANQSGTWTVQPGNTPNTTAWLVGLNTTPSIANGNGVVPGVLATWGLAASTQNVASPTNGMLVEGQFNTTPTTLISGNVSPLQMDSAGNLLVNIKTGASSVAQGSTTSGQTGTLVQGAVTTAAPTYTTAQTSPLSLDTTGNLRVSVSNTLAALTLGDGIATGTYASGSPTLGGVLLWNGTTYDRWKSTATGYAGVNPGTPANWGLGATAAAVPANAIYAGALDAVGGANLVGLAADPCQTSVKTTIPITLATAAVKVIVTGVAAKKTYVCQINLNNNAADTVAVFEATTATVCVTSPVAMVGAGTSVATAGTGYNFAATGGISMGNGANQVLVTTVNNNDICIAQSAATQLTGSITYATR